MAKTSTFYQEGRQELLPGRPLDRQVNDLEQASGSSESSSLMELCRAKNVTLRPRARRQVHRATGSAVNTSPRTLPERSAQTRDVPAGSSPFRFDGLQNRLAHIAGRACMDRQPKDHAG